MDWNVGEKADNCWCHVGCSEIWFAAKLGVGAKRRGIVISLRSDVDQTDYFMADLFQIRDI